jgi:hypothetical protein
MPTGLRSWRRRSEPRPRAYARLTLTKAAFRSLVRVWQDAAASRRSCSWPAPPPRGGYCPPESSAAARRRPAGGASPSGPRPACSTSSIWRCWTGWRAGPAGLVAGQCGHHERAGQAWGDQVGAHPVDRGKPGSKLQLVCDGGGLPLTAVVTAATWPTPPCSRRSWMTFHRSVRRRAVGAPDRPRSTPIRHTTALRTERTCGVVGSGRGSPGVGWSRRCGLGATAGESSGRRHG